MVRLVLHDIDVETAEKLGEMAALAPDEEASDPRFAREHGFLVFTGSIATEEIPDHRTLRDDRVDSLLKGIDEDRV